MRRRFIGHGVLGCAAAIAVYVAGGAMVQGQAPLALNSARITINGTSNIHSYTASTTTVRITRAEIDRAVAGPDVLATALKPGAVCAFEVAIPVTTLKSPKADLDKNMHKALKADTQADITFRLLRFEPKDNAPDAVRAIGVLKIAGVEREVAFDLTTKRNGSTLAATGTLRLLMTDFGITPPVALLGMLKTDPKVSITFETLLTVPGA
jgi:hypothetical protein